jgi:hypothetical protein
VGGGQREEQDIGGAVRLEMSVDGRDALDGWIDPALGLL